ncbi:hypothetical protein ACHAWO_009943 [Cyclotella atomus]|uniref:Uncharacterized protein n=1 Tax=Cyclotella atomus TaxID=382360 RepID=A0ABD3PI28_9STRA
MNSHRRSEETDYTTHFSIMESTAKADEEGTLLTTIHQPVPLEHTCSTTTVSTQPQEDDFDDTAWSIYSNFYFLSGGLFYLVATSWDYSLFHNARDAEIDEVLSLAQRVLYEFLWFMGPLTYLLNSFIDVRWALKVRKRDVRRRELEKLLVGKKTTKQKQKAAAAAAAKEQEELEEGGTEVIRREHAAIGEETPENYYSLSIEQSTPKRKHRLRRIISPTKKIFHRMRKHMGHRRDLAAAISFGMAAALSVTGATCYLISTQGKFSFVIHSARKDIAVIDSDLLASWAGSLERASIHMYLVSAIFALWRNPCKNSVADEEADTEGFNDTSLGSMSWFHARIILPISRPFNDVDSMETVGDIFFGLASVVDVILEDSTLDDNVLWWPIISALLWTLDALFYLRGDFVTLYLRNAVLSSEEDDGQLNSALVALDGKSFDELDSDQQVWTYPKEGNKTANRLVLD